MITFAAAQCNQCHLPSSQEGSLPDNSVTSCSVESDAMAEVYPFPAIRVARIARDSEKTISDFQLTAESAQQLDEDQAGVLIANCGTSDRIHEKVLKLAETEYPAPWVVVMSSIELTRAWYGVQHRISTRQIDANSPANSFWRTGNCWFTRLERLEALTRTPEFRGPIAGVILVDPEFRTQFARGLKNSQWSHNDRPELMNRFRAELADDGLRPPLLFMACPPAKSLNTLPAQRAYCLETLWYADGSRLRIGKI
jgi:hypothetical protein